jgi:hypothetical protein
MFIIDFAVYVKIYTDPKGDTAMSIIKIATNFSLSDGEKIALKGDAGNYNYLSRQGADDLWFSKPEPDQFCFFEVTVLKGDQIALKTDAGRYWSRSGAENIKANKTAIDQWCKWTVKGIVWNPSKDEHLIALQEPDHGKFLSRWGEHEIKAVKEGIDIFCLLRVTRLVG